MLLLRTLISALTLFSFIVTRDDVDDQRYIDHAKRSEFQSFCYFSDGACTLVAEHWVLTARHVGEGLASGDTVYVGNETARIRTIVLYPERSTYTPDLALIELDRSIGSDTPALLPRTSPGRDTQLHLIGRGDTGTGRTGPTAWDKVIRAATNLIDEVSETHLVFRFDAPGSERVTDLEGISGPGDSGGPAYVWADDGVQVVGVSSAQDHSGQSREGVYGVTEYYVNVAPYMDWIAETLKGHTYVILEEGTNVITAILQGQDVLRLQKNGAVLPTTDIDRYRDRVLARAEAQESVEAEVPPGERVPAFIRYIFQIANEAGITEEVRPVGFTISETALVIERQKMEEQYLEKARTRYRELFGKPIQGEFKFELD